MWQQRGDVAHDDVSLLHQLVGSRTMIEHREPEGLADRHPHTGSAAPAQRWQHMFHTCCCYGQDHRLCGMGQISDAATPRLELIGSAARALWRHAQNTPRLEHRQRPTERLPVHLAAAELEAVRRALASIPDISEAWLARRDAREMPEWKSYVLIMRFGFSAFRFVTQGRIQGLLQQAADSLELDGFLVVLHDKGNNKPVAKCIRAVDGTRVAGKDG